MTSQPIAPTLEQAAALQRKWPTLLLLALAELLDWSAQRVRSELHGFFDERWTARRPVLTGQTLAQEEILRAYHSQVH